MARNAGSGRGNGGRGRGSNRPNSSNRTGNQQGSTGGNSNRNKKKSSTIPIDKLKFAVGDSQAENVERLVEHLAKQALKDYGKKMAYILQNEAEYPMPAPKLAKLDTDSIDKAIRGDQDLFDEEKE